ncbi:hypothetical protein [Helicobacter felis]|uniref:hypothetical protein n=1 Tax=Helicobacter felis TaxID=214 RepID=UPI000CED9C90|nr:hypothetical protein [Helicobacter felis]
MIGQKIYMGRTSSWSYDVPPGGAREFLVTITGCSGEDRQYGDNENEGNSEVYYNRGNSGPVVVFSADELNIRVAGGAGSARMLRRRGEWHSREESYYKDGWEKFWGKKRWRTIRWWEWNGVLNQRKPVQSGQSIAFVCSASTKLSCTSSKEFSLCVYEI